MRFAGTSTNWRRRVAASKGAVANSTVPVSTGVVPSIDRQTVLIVERGSGGHRLCFVRILAEAAVDQGASVLLALARDITDANAFEVHLASLSGQVKIVLAPDTLDGIRQLSEEHSAHLTVIPDGDRIPIELIKARGWRGHGQLRVLIMRSGRTTFDLSGLRLVVKTGMINICSLQRSVRMVRLISALQVERRSGGRVASTVDPVGSFATMAQVDQLRGEWQMDPARYWCIVIGAVNARKNLGMVVEAALLSRWPKPAGIVVAGTITPAVMSALDARRKALSDAGIELRVHDRLLTNVEFDAALGAADCVIVAHSNEGPSSVLAKAAVGGTRILAAGARSLREDCANMSEGATWVPLTIPAISGALEECAKLPRPGGSLVQTPSEFTGALLW